MKLSYRSFAAGEVSRRLGARVDQVKYQTGAYTMRNMVSTLEGAVQNRAGFGYIRPCHDFTATNPPRILPFVFSDDQSYVIVLEHERLSVISLAEPQFVAAVNVSAITQANPCKVTTAGAHGLATGNLVWLSGIGGMTQLNNRFFRAVLVDADEFTLQEESGAAVSSVGYGAFTAGGTVKEVYTITAPWDGADLRQIRFAQSADVMFLTHPDYPVHTLTRTTGPVWVLAETEFDPDIDAPTNTAITGSAGAERLRYRVTAVADDTLEESFFGFGPVESVDLDLLGTSSPYRVTLAAHGMATGDPVYFPVQPGLPTSDQYFTITVTGVNTFTLDGTNDGGTTQPYVGAGLFPASAAGTFAVPSSGAPVNVTWTAVTGALEYNIYREINGVYAYMGTSGGTSFEDLGYSLDPSDTPPIDRDPFAATGDYPAAVGLFQQRLLLGGSLNQPERIDAGRTGLFYNFTKSNPIQADDSFSWQMRSNQVQGIRHILEMSRCLVFTQSSVFTLEGNEAGTLVPTAINPRKRAEHGVGDVAPIPVGNAVIYVQAFGKIVREILPGSGDDFNSKDLTVYSRHLFDRNSVIAWSYAEEPTSSVWAVRDDGTLLGFTYLREHEVWGWHRHDTGQGDKFIDVCSVPEGEETATYAVVRRFGVGEGDRYYIERMASRQVAHQADGRFLDSYRYQEDENATVGDTYTLDHDDEDGWSLEATGTTANWITGELSTDLGRIILLYGSEGQRYWCTVLSITDANVAVVSVRTDIPGKYSDDDTSVWQTAIEPINPTTEEGGGPGDLFPEELPFVTAEWSQSVASLTDLWHLEGRGVRVVGDGYPQGPFIVTDGTITLANPAVQVVAGIQIIADLVTLEADNPNGETWTGKTKTVSEIDVRVEETDGLRIGTSWSTLANWDQTHRLDRPLPVEDQPYTGTYRASCGGLRSLTGRVHMRQTLGLPTTILGVYPTMSLEGR